jgi:hypothetical protein
MNRRNIRAALLGVLLVAATAWSQDRSSGQFVEDQFVAEARELLQAGRREIIAEELRLTDAEAESFWPVYDKYQADMMVVRDRYVEIIGGYLARYEAGDLSDKYAKDLLDDWLDYKADKLKVTKQYVRKFGRVLSMRKVVRFYQLENKMDAEIDAELAVFVPLMDPF